MAAMKRRSDYISVLLSLCSLCAHQLVSDCMRAHTAVCNYIFIDVCSHIYLFLQDVCLPLCFSVCACRCALTNGELNGDGWDVKTLLPPPHHHQINLLTDAHTDTHSVQSFDYKLVSMWINGFTFTDRLVPVFPFLSPFISNVPHSFVQYQSVFQFLVSLKKNTRFLCFHFCVLVLNTFSSLPVHCPFINYLVCK